VKISDISVEYVDHMGSDLSVVNAARVSFAKESDWIELQREIGEESHVIAKVLSEGDRKLINYLAKHKHYSPFNHTFLSFRIKAPIFVARQLVKHEYMPWNEVSRRYVDDEPEFYIPPMLHGRADNVKQGCAQEATISPASLATYTDGALCAYNNLLAEGVAPEEARMVLPHNLMTEWVWSGTLKAFHKMLTLRLDPHTQGATRIVAEKIAPMIQDLFPVSYPALMENN
jgi:thymidylate synthase (FAD)